MSDDSFSPEKMDHVATNAKETVGELFLADPCELACEDCMEMRWLKQIGAQRKTEATLQSAI